jgi:hypothetical protein
LAAHPNVADHEQALGLRSSWSVLTENVAEPAQWIEGTHRFVYRKTVPGGFQFVVMDAETKQKQPAFDHQRRASADGGVRRDLLEMLFDITVRAAGGGEAILLSSDGCILLVVGELDMNVDPASTMQVVNAFTKARKADA